MRTLLVILSLLTIVVLFLPLACERQSQTITLGYIGVMSGRSSGLGIDGRDGFLLALHEANRERGIDGRELKALVLDSGKEAVRPEQLMTQLTAGKAVAAVGPMRSQVASSLIPLASKASMVLVSPTVSSDAFSGQDDFFFRNYFSNRQSAEGMAQLVSQRGLQRIAVLYNIDNRAYTEDYLASFRSALEKLGGTIVDAVPFSSLETPNYSQLAEPIFAHRPAGLLLLANAVDSAMFCQQLSKREKSIPVFTTPWSFTDDLVAFGGKAVEGVTLLLTIDPHSSNPAYVDFRNAFMEQYGREPRFSAIHAYDATRLLIAGLRRSRQEGLSLKESLLQLETFPGVQHSIRFDAYGDLDTPRLYPVQVEKGDFRVIDSGS